VLLGLLLFSDKLLAFGELDHCLTLATGGVLLLFIRYGGRPGVFG
jgi:hypothetical protein